jgi:hypothetical protein
MRLSSPSAILFAGITNRYDYVLEIKDGFINQYPIQDYYQEAS